MSMFQVGHLPAHKGKTTTTDAIRDVAQINAIRELLRNDLRGLTLWNVAINSALRAGDLVKLTWDDVIDDGKVITLLLLEGKTRKRRVVPLNEATSSSLRAWRSYCDHAHIYSGQRGPLTTATWGRMVKGWCEAVGIEGRFASHTARKTFVRIQHDVHGTSLTTLMHVLNHSTPTQTMTYMGRMDEDVAQAYKNEV